jgi:proton-dependent oligopeptide transporter, POT family
VHASWTLAALARRTSPDQESKGWPPGIPYIIGNEGCERFSYYGMRSILTLYLAEVLYARHPAFAAAPEVFARAHFHLFVAGVYALPMVGAVIADRLLGKYRTILWLSMVYAAGNLTLAAFPHDTWGVWTGLALISIGAGGIKPCVSAHVGDQFGKGNWFRLRTIYQAFYFIINFGSFFANLLIPWLWHHFGIRVAFGVPGVLMLGATVVFWMGRNVFIHVPPNPGGRLGLLDAASSTALFLSIGHLFFSAGQPWPVLLGLSAGFLALGVVLFRRRQALAPDDGFLAVLLYAVGAWLKKPTRTFFAPAVARFGAGTVEGPVAALRITSVFVLVSLFWALFDQHGSTWILQAKMMDLHLAGDVTALPSQVQAANPLLVMLLIPFTNKVLFPVLERLHIRPTPLQRMTAGMVLTAASFVAAALVQAAIDRSPPASVWFGWQMIAYVLITLGEVLVSITGLEFAYSQAPRRMKSTIMGFWLLAVTLGNVLVSLISRIALPLAQSFWLFAGLMAIAALLFGVRAHFYKARDYVQQ